MKAKIRAPKYTTTLPGGRILGRIMRLLVAAVASGLVYGIITRRTVHFCSSAADPAVSGEETLEPAAQALGCGTLTLSPSSWVYLALAVMAIVLLSHALRTAPDEATAVRLIRRAGMIVPLVALVAAGAALLAFQAILAEDLLADPPPSVSVPFGSVELERTD